LIAVGTEFNLTVALMSPRVLILRAPGTNCDLETAYAFELAGAQPERLHVNQLLAQPSLATQFQILCLPGGFSYGDDISAGTILGSQIRHHLTACLEDFRQREGLILGICNGFQILMRTGMLLPEEASGPLATLTLNNSGKFEDRWVKLGVDGKKCVFLAGIEQLYMPVAHAEGKFVTRDADVLKNLSAAGQLVLRYQSESGGNTDNQELAYPANPNGAQANVAGVCDATGRVFGLMPHPERFVDPTHHPRWTRERKLDQAGEGLEIFRNAVRFFN